MQISQSDTSNEILIPRAFTFLRQPKRYKILYGGRDGAKSHNIARTLLIIGTEKPLRIVCAREIQKSIKDSVHELLSDLILKYPKLTEFYTVRENEIVGKNGTQIKFRGLKHNTRDLKSLEGCDILWIEEAEIVSDNSYEIVIPTIRKEGSEIWISFNPKNATDPTWERFVANQDDNVIAKKVSYRDNPFTTSVMIQERERLLKADPEAFKHVYEGEFDTRYSGAVYAKWVASLQERGRINARVVHDPAYPVYTAWDLGWGDFTSIIFYQEGEGEIFIIDYYETNQEDVRHYAEILCGREIIINERDLETGDVIDWQYGEDIEKHKHRKDYRYEADFMPADSKGKHLAAAGKSVLEQMRDFDRKVFWLPETTHKNRHEALRLTFPKCWVNSEKCKDLISAWMHYHYEYDDDLKRFSKDPVHDWSSHASTAGELMARATREKAVTVKELDRRDLVNSFHSKRRENNLVQEDPYRLRRK